MPSKSQKRSVSKKRTSRRRRRSSTRKHTLNKIMRGDTKKFKVYVRDPHSDKIKKVEFGARGYRIKKSNPARRRSFRSRHRCSTPGPKTKARYWACKTW